MRFSVVFVVLLACLGSVVGNEGDYSDSDYSSEYYSSHIKVGRKHDEGIEPVITKQSSEEIEEGSEENRGRPGGSPNIGCAATTCLQGSECVIRNRRPICRPLPSNPCSTHTCKPGYTCRLQQVQCIRAPCPPIPQCVPNCLSHTCPVGQACALNANSLQATCNKYANRCELMRCISGTSCEVSLQCTPEKCVPVFECVPSCNGFPCREGQQCEMRDNICPNFMTLQYPPKKCYPKVPQCVNNQPTCLDHRCEVNQHCELSYPSCPPPPPDVRQPYCSPIPVCVNNPTCNDIDCEKGFYCELLPTPCARPVPGIYSPCYPRPVCLKKPTCADLQCPAGQTCQLIRPYCPPGQTCIAKPTCVDRYNPCASTTCQPGYSCKIKSGECKDYGDSVREPVERCYPKPYCSLDNNPCDGPRPPCDDGHICQATRTQCLQKPCDIVTKCVPPPCRLARPAPGFICVNKEVICDEKPCPLGAFFKPSCISKTCDDASTCRLRPKQCGDEPCDLEATCVSDPCKLTGDCPRG